HFYLDGGHVIDFINKAFELLDRIGWEHAADVLPSLIRQLSGAQRSEEQNSWRSPVDLVTLLSETFASLNRLLEEGQGGEWKRDSGFAEELLRDDPHAIVAALNEALRQGARPVQLAEAVALAAALRIVKFHVRNEFSDWISVLHTFSYANALHQMLKRAESPEMLRGVYHGAMRVYLDRFLNVPAARLPNPSAAEADDGKAMEEYLHLLNQQQQVDEAGRLVNSFLTSGGEPEPLFRTLAESLVREDAEFHSFQMLEAAIRQYGERTDVDEQRILMVAAARFLAAKAPTQRELLQTLQIAQRLHRGEAVYEED
ncbi:MAG: Rieske (2Fe-2S) protein, partial [Gemmatimonadota bacterium]|nr:Rieske (2Fe-2S) protein [Gemmatimonadota bacterium]